MTNNITELNPEMISLRKASERTGISYDWLRKLCLMGKIVHIRAGGTKFLINYQKLVEYLNTGDQEEGVQDE